MRNLLVGVFTLGVLLLSCSHKPGMDVQAPTNDFQVEIDRYQARLDSTIQYLEQESNRFGLDQVDQFEMVGKQSKHELMTSWAGFLDYMAHLDLIRFANQGAFQQFNGEIDFHSLVMYYQTFLIQSTRAMQFIRVIDRNGALETILDEAYPEYGLDVNTYSQFKTHFLHVKQTAEYGALRVMYRNKRPEINPYYAKIAMLEGYATNLGWDYGVKRSVKHASDVIGDQSYSWWFPLQKDIASWAGHTRFFRENKHLISNENIADIETQIDPADIFFQRREWYLTNAGIPGYWTHAALYVGSPEERSEYFADDSVAAWVQSEGVASGLFEDLLELRFPAAYTSHTTPDDSSRTKTVLEAISPGVVFQSLHQSLTCDGLGVLRPHFSKLDKAYAIYTAFQYHGRGYDYNFDFVTDSTLVCSELIYKSFFPTVDHPGIAFKTEKVAGRLMTPANRMVRQFDQEYNTLGLDFVLFYDGDEMEQVSKPGNLDQFRKSWRRLGIYPLVSSESLLIDPEWVK